MQQRRRISAVRQRPTLAILLSVALVASGLAAAGTHITRTQGDGIGPVEVMNNSTTFDNGSNVVVDDAAISAQGEGDGPRTVKEFQREEPFSMFALTWKGQKEVTAFVRAEQADGTWSEWYDMEPQASANTDPNATNGTELIFHGSTNKIQVSTHNIELFGEEAQAGASDEAGEAIPEAAPVEAPAEAPVEDTPPVAEYAAEPVAEPAAEPVPAAPEVEPVNDGLAPLPSNYGDIQPVADTASDLDAVFIDGNAGAAGGGVELMADTDGMPKVVSRAGWGANEGYRCSNPTIDDGVSAITIHHTAGSNNYTPAESAAQMRGYYSYHAQSLGWCDIGYQALVDKYGTIYEGRYGGLTRAVQGAHSGGFNQNTWAISMMGDYSNVTPSDATIKSVGELAGWRAKVAGFEPKGSDTHYSEGSSYTYYPYGTRVTLPNIFAHRDVGNTSCPGEAGYAQMGKIRDIAQAKYTSLQGGGNGAAPSTSAGNSPNEPGTGSTEPEPAVGSSSLNEILTGGSSGGTELLNGANSEQLLTGLGSIIAIALGIAATQGDLGAAIGNNNGVPVLENIKLDDVIPIVDTVIGLTGDTKYSRAWNDLNNLLGPVLGGATGGETTVGYASERNSEVSFVPFEKGIMVSSPEAGTHGIWGVIGDTWMQQGAEVGPLGLPINHEYSDGNLLRVDFQGGYITFDPTTGDANIQLN